MATCLSIIRRVRRNPLVQIVKVVEKMHSNENIIQQCSDLQQKWDIKCDRDEINIMLKHWCMIIIWSQQIQTMYNEYYFSKTITYQPLIALFLKMASFDESFSNATSKGLEKLLQFQDEVIEKAGYQKIIYPDLASMFCAVACHLRVRYIKATDDQLIANLFDQTKDLFECSIECGEYPYEFALAEYAAFLYIARRYDEALSILKRRPYVQISDYNHFVEGHGYLEVKSKNFMLWVKLNIALETGSPVENIIKEYEDLLREQSKAEPILMDEMETSLLAGMNSVFFRYLNK